MRTIIAILFFLPVQAYAQDTLQPATSSYVRAEVEFVSNERVETFADIQRSVQDVRLRILDGVDAGRVIMQENGILGDRKDMRLQKGEKVILQRLEHPNGKVDYLLQQKYRLRSLLFLTLLFVGLAVLLGGKTGFMSMVGLGASVLILLLFVIPRILEGHNPLFISFVGSVCIACSSIYLAHGFNRRTSIALFSTIITLVCSTIMAVIFVRAAKLFGMGTEEAVFLQFGPMEQVDLRGLLLGGIVIGALGVLDDITTAQTAAIDELSKANAKLGRAQLYAAGTSIGREHIASLINTLALAYVGVSLPLLLLFYMGTDTPWWVILNNEFLAEEIVRTLVGSATLLMAVPISTYMAARAFAYGNSTNARGHSHVH